jgi:hypothetical protein
MSAFGYRDPLDDLFRRLDMIGRLPGESTRQPAAPPMSDEEFNGALSSLLDKSLGGLQWVGETLDKPGRAVRGLLSGRPEELLNLIPLSDTFRWTDPKTSVSGRQLLDEWGVTPPNQEGFHPFDAPGDALGDAAGFGAEILLDPLTYLPGGFLGRAATKGGQVMKRVGFHTDDLLKAAAKNLGKEATGVRQAGMHVTMEDLLAQVPKGTERTQKLMDVRRAAREMGVNIGDVRGQPVSEALGFGLPLAREPAFTIGGAGTLGEGYAKMLDRVGSGVANSKAGSVVRSLFDRDILDSVDPAAQNVLGRAVPKIRAKQAGYTDEMFKMLGEHPYFQSDEGAKAWKAYQELGPEYAQKYREMGIDVAQMTPEQMKTLDPIIESEKVLKAEYELNGMDAGKRGIGQSDYGVGYSRHGASKPDELNTGAADIAGAGKRFKKNAQTMKARKSPIADVPGGQTALNEMTKDAQYVGPNRPRAQGADRQLLTRNDVAAQSIFERFYKPSVDELGDNIPNVRQAVEDALDERAMLKGIPDKGVARWENDVRELAKEHGVNPGVLRKAARERFQNSYGEFEQTRDAVRQFNHALEPILENIDRPLKNAILAGEVDVAHPLFQRFDELHQELAGMFPGMVPNDPQGLVDLIRRGKADVPKAMKLNRDFIADVAQDFNLHDIPIVDDLSDTSKTVLTHYGRARKLAKYLGTEVDPRHVTSGKGLFEMNPMRNHRDYMADLTLNTGLGTSVHRMFADTAQVIPKGQAVPAGYLKLAEAVKNAGFDKVPVAAKRSLELLTEKTGAMHHAGEVYVPAKIVTEANKLLKRGQSSESISALGEAVDTITSWFKSGVTMFPAFHSRNLSGGQIQNFISGLVGPIELKRMGEIAKEATEGVSEIKGLAKTTTVFGKTDAAATRRLYEEIATHGVWQHKFNDELVPTAATTATELFPDVGMKGVDRLLAPSAPASIGGALKGFWTRLRQQGLKGMKPVGEQSLFTNTKEVHRQVGDIVEGLNRISPYVALRKKGYSAETAATMVKFAQVDYSNLTEFESKFLRRVFPFWTFNRGIAENVGKTLLEHPGGALAQTVRATNKTRGEDTFLPDYVGEGMAIPTGPEGQYVTQLGLMHESPFEWFALTPTLGGTVKRGAQKVAANLSPYLKLPIEQATGVNLFTGRPQTDLYQYPFSGDTGAGRLANSILGNSPLSRAVNTVRRTTDERKSYGVRALGLTTGIGVADLSGGVEKAKELQARKAVTEILKQSPRIKEASNLYVPEEFKGTETPDEVENMRFAKALQKRRTEESKKRKLKLLQRPA